MILNKSFLISAFESCTYESRTIKIPPSPDGLFYYGRHPVHGTVEIDNAHTPGRKIDDRDRLDSGPADGRLCRVDHTEDARS